MALSKNVGPCEHGGLEAVCWRCTREKIGVFATAREWFRHRRMLRRWQDDPRFHRPAPPQERPRTGAPKPPPCPKPPPRPIAAELEDLRVAVDQCSLAVREAAEDHNRAIEKLASRLRGGRA